jgi:hypothetical protein
MVFVIPGEFRAPKLVVAGLALGAERAVFEMLVKSGNT